METRPGRVYTEPTEKSTSQFLPEEPSGRSRGSQNVASPPKLSRDAVKYVTIKPLPLDLLQSPAMFRLYHRPNGRRVLRERCSLLPCGIVVAPSAVRRLGSGLTLRVFP
jgi:hypothetical protein